MQKAMSVALVRAIRVQGSLRTASLPTTRPPPRPADSTATRAGLRFTPFALAPAVRWRLAYQ